MDAQPSRRRWLALVGALWQVVLCGGACWGWVSLEMILRTEGAFLAREGAFSNTTTQAQTQNTTSVMGGTGAFDCRTREVWSEAKKKWCYGTAMGATDAEEQALSLNLVYLFGFVAASGGGLPVGILLDKCGPRFVATASASLFLVGNLLMGAAVATKTWGLLFPSYTIVGLAAPGLLFSVFHVATRHFPATPGVIFALINGGFDAAGLVYRVIGSIHASGGVFWVIQVVYCVICVLPLFAFALGGLWDEDAVVGGGDEKGDGKGGGGGIGDGIGDGIGNGGVEGNKKGEGRREEDKGLDSGGGNGTEEAATIQKGVPEIQTWRGFVGELRRPEYALFALYFSLCMTRFSWVLGTLDPTMRSLANATAMGTPTVNFTATATAAAAAAAAAAAGATGTDTATEFLILFGTVFPCCSVAVVVAGPVMDRGGVLVALVCVSTLCLAQTLLGLFSPLGAGQVASFVFFGFYRAFLFALLPMYMMTVHGPLYFGTLTGLAGFIASMVSLVQYPLLQLVLGSLGGDFAPVTRGFAVAIACGFAFPLILFFKWGRRGMPPPRGVGSVGGRGKESPLAVPPAGREGGGGSSGGGGGQVEEGGSNTGRPVVSGGSGASDQIVPVPAAVHDEVC